MRVKLETDALEQPCQPPQTLIAHVTPDEVDEPPPEAPVHAAYFSEETWNFAATIGISDLLLTPASLKSRTMAGGEAERMAFLETRQRGDALVGILTGRLSLAAEEPRPRQRLFSGGAIATAFGTAAVFGGQRHEFLHVRNLLREVWEGPGQVGIFSHPFGDF